MFGGAGDRPTAHLVTHVGFVHFRLASTATGDAAAPAAILVGRSAASRDHRRAAADHGLLAFNAERRRALPPFQVCKRFTGGAGSVWLVAI